MPYKADSTFEEAQARISNITKEIEVEIDQILGIEDIDDIISDEDKSDFIFKQTMLLDAYRIRDVHDHRDAYIKELEVKLAYAEREAKANTDLLSHNKRLIETVNALTGIITDQNLG